MAPKIDLPRPVHKVTSRGRPYFYWQLGRGTPQQGPRIRLPDDPRSPEFWAAIRKLEGTPERTDTIGALIDAYVAAWPGLRKKLAPSTQDYYRRYLKYIRTIWGHLPAAELTPRDVEALITKIGVSKPGRANNVLYALRSMCSWARGPAGHLTTDPTHGVKVYESEEGHLPWTTDQIAFAHESFTGMMRRAFFLGCYTGQRVSDLVRLSWDDVQGNNIPLRQKKTGARPVCPILPELKAEMDTWERRPGPFLLQESGRNKGKPFSPNGLWKMFDKVRKDQPVLEGTVPHGWRANAVIRLRTAGHSALLISDVVGLSVEMVEHYCRHQDKTESARVVLAGHMAGAAVKHLKNGQQE